MHDRFRGVLYLHRAAGAAFSKAEGELVAALASLLANGLERAELKERVFAEQQHRRQLERFHPPEVIDQLLVATPRRGAELVEHTGTALVCDMRGFEQLINGVAPAEVAAVLNEYYDLLYEKIFANGGSLVKLHEGWALALFGMHDGSERESVWAVEAARQICEDFIALSVLWPRSNELRLRCALDSGTLVSGVVGSGDRLEYVAIGSPIANARELAAWPERTTVLVTEGAWRTLPPRRYPAEQLQGPSGEVVFKVAI